jgi:hypothetical protein
MRVNITGRVSSYAHFYLWIETYCGMAPDLKMTAIAYGRGANANGRFHNARDDQIVLEAL